MDHRKALLLLTTLALTAVSWAAVASGESHHTSRAEKFLHDIRDPCGSPISSTDVQDLPNMRIIISSVQDSASKLRDLMLSMVGNLRLQENLLKHPYRYIERLNPSRHSLRKALRHPRITQVKVIRLLYVYLAKFRYIQESYVVPNSVKQEVRTLGRNYVRSLQCAVEVVASHFKVNLPGTAIDNAVGMLLSYNAPNNRIFIVGTAAQLLHAFTNDYLAFLNLFYEKVLK